MHNINSKTLNELQNSGGNPLVVNVLPEQAFAEEHIPGSCNIPVGSSDFASRVEKAASRKSRDVVVYCADKSCDASEKAARQLEAAGFERVHDFAGGMKEWKQAGLPVDSQTQAKSGSR